MPITHTKPCRLQNARTGRVISAPSINAFCRKANLHGIAGGWNAAIGAVLMGRKQHFRGWFDPSIAPRKAVKVYIERHAAKGKDRRCHLVHLASGRVINTRSIGAFCRKARLKGNDLFHITPVLDGKRLHHKGWYNPEIINEKVTLRDVYGTQYRPIKIATLIKTHGLSGIALSRILSGRLLMSKTAGESRTRRVGLTLSSSPVKGALSPRGWQVSEYAFKERDTSRRGRSRVYRGSVLSELAAQMGVESSRLYPLLYGWTPRVKSGEHRHIVVEEVKVEKKVTMPDIGVIRS